MKRIVLILIVIVISSCGLDSLKPVGYVKWVENVDNGLKAEKIINEVAYTIQYKPSDYIVAMEQKDPMLKEEILKERKEQLKGMQYYTLRISPKDKVTEVLSLGTTVKDEYYQRMDYVSFDMQNDIFIVENNDTLNCSMYHFVREYGITPNVDLLLGFNENVEINSDKEIIFEDKIWGGGIIKFTINKKDIEKIPSIITY